MTERIASKYAANSIASAKKHIFARLIDYFLTFICSLALFAVILPVSMNFPVYEKIGKELSSSRKAFYQYVDSTGILHYNEEHTDLLSVNDEADLYLENLAKTSAYVHKLGFPVKQSDGTYLNREVEIEETFIYDKDNYPLDNISYYYRIFKKNYDELNNYNGKKYEELTYDELEEYQYSYIMKLNASNYVDSSDPDYSSRGEGVSTYVVLTLENTEQILRFYKNDHNDTKLYNSIYGCYGKGLQKAISEIENKSIAYKAILNRINAASNLFSTFQLVVYFICYTIIYFLLTLIVSLTSKEWNTVGLKVMRLAMCEKGENEPPTWKYIVYHVLCYLGYFTSSLLAFVMLGNLGITALKVIGPITFLMMMAFILPFNLVSLFMPLFNKNYHYDLVTFFLRIVFKDKNEFDVPVGMDISDKVEDGTREN